MDTFAVLQYRCMLRLSGEVAGGGLARRAQVTAPAQD